MARQRLSWEGCGGARVYRAAGLSWKEAAALPRISCLVSALTPDEAAYMLAADPAQAMHSCDTPENLWMDGSPMACPTVKTSIHLSLGRRAISACMCRHIADEDMCMLVYFLQS